MRTMTMLDIARAAWVNWLCAGAVGWGIPATVLSLLSFEADFPAYALLLVGSVGLYVLRDLPQQRIAAFYDQQKAA